jgi:hypothetical protein
MCKRKIVIFDEAGYGIVNYVVYFGDKADATPLSLISLRFAKHVYLLRATYSSHSMHVLKKCFGITKSFIKRFKSASQIIN